MKHCITGLGSALPPATGLDADVWAAGVLAYELLVGAPPFEADSKADTYAAILEKQPWLPQHLSAAARDFITQVGRGGCMTQATHCIAMQSCGQLLANAPVCSRMRVAVRKEQAWHRRPGEYGATLSCTHRVAPCLRRVVRKRTSHL